MPYLRLYANRGIDNVVTGVNRGLYALVASVGRLRALSCRYVVSGFGCSNALLAPRGFDFGLLFRLLLSGSYGLRRLVGGVPMAGAAASMGLANLGLGYVAGRVLGLYNRVPAGLSVLGMARTVVGILYNLRSSITSVLVELVAVRAHVRDLKSPNDKNCDRPRVAAYLSPMSDLGGPVPALVDGRVRSCASPTVYGLGRLMKARTRIGRTLGGRYLSSCVNGDRMGRGTTGLTRSLTGGRTVVYSLVREVALVRGAYYTCAYGSVRVNFARGCSRPDGACAVRFAGNTNAGVPLMFGSYNDAFVLAS